MLEEAAMCSLFKIEYLNRREKNELLVAIREKFERHKRHRIDVLLPRKEEKEVEFRAEIPSAPHATASNVLYAERDSYDTNDKHNIYSVKGIPQSSNIYLFNPQSSRMVVIYICLIHNYMKAYIKEIR
jgi:hypothetical protein